MTLPAVPQPNGAPEAHTSSQALPEVPQPPPPLPRPIDETKVSIVFYRDKLATIAIPVTVSWATIVQTFTAEENIEQSPCTVEDGPKKCVGKKCPYKEHSSTPDGLMAWSPVEIEGRRLDKNVRFVTMLTLDFDHLQAPDVAVAVQKLSAWEHVLHTTHNHRPDDMCFRAILPLSRKVAASQWHRFLASAVAFLAVPADPVCKNRSRLYFRPSHPRDAQQHDATHNRGRVLDVDEILTWGANRPEAQPVADTDAAELPSTTEWNLAGELVQEAIDHAANYFPPQGRRNELCMAYAGMLRRAGASQETAKYIVSEIARQGGSDDPDARAATVDHTYGLADDSWMTGLTRAAEILDDVGLDGDEIARQFGDLLFEASHEVLLASVRLRQQEVASQSGIPATVDLSVLRSEVSALVSRRARSLERDEKIDAVILRRVLDGQCLALPGGQGDVETVLDDATTGIGRKSALQRVTGMLAFNLPDTTPWDAVAEILRLSVTKMESTPSDDWMGKAEKSFKHAQVKRITEDEKRRVAKETARTDAVERALGGEIVPLRPSSPPDGDDWRDRLDKNAAGDISASFANISAIIANDENLCGTIRWNDYKKDIEVTGGILQRFAGNDPNSIIVGLQDYLVRVWGVMASFSDCSRRVMMIAHQNAYDPLIDYLSSLKWDGNQRADTFLQQYFGVRDTRHLRRISRRWLIGAVARAFESGCKFDNVLVFEDLQGEKKTSAFEALGGRFYCSTEVNIRDKDAKMLAACSWLIELAEIDTIQKSDNSLNKAFITTRVDKFRPPWGAALQESKRRCVFVGTTNEQRYFTDATGNRRYWPARCGVIRPIDLAALLRDADQIWAEAVLLYLAHKNCSACALANDTVYGQSSRCEDHRWWLTKEEEKEAREETNIREEDPPWMAWAEKIIAWWRAMPVSQRPETVTAAQVAMYAGELPVDRINRRILTEIGLAMPKIGFERNERRRCYVPSDELKRDSGRKGLFVLPGGKKEESSKEGSPPPT